LVKLKRIYEKPHSSDGIRVLVDRLWPRGVSKSRAKIDEWVKEIAPSDGLRKWYGHQPDRWKEFEKRYERELRSAERKELIRLLRSKARGRTVTVLFAAKDQEHSNAKVLVRLLKQM